MKIQNKIIVTCAAALICATVGLEPAMSQQAAMSFFLTSANAGNGGDLGGLAGADQYCEKLAVAAGTSGNWTQSGAGSAIVGHHDRVGLNESAPMKSWNASHGTRACDMAALKSTGGSGLYYCFAAN